MEAEEEKERGRQSETLIFDVNPPTHTHTHITVEYAQIDWHSFVIVETINFRESEAGKQNQTITA